MCLCDPIHFSTAYIKKDSFLLDCILCYLDSILSVQTDASWSVFYPNVCYKLPHMKARAAMWHQRS